MILDVCSALALLLEPPVVPDIVRVALDLEPLTWEANHLYVYPVRVSEVPFETGHSRRQEFDLNAVYIADNGGEEAQLERSEALAVLLDMKRGQYMQAVRANQATGLWSMLRAVSDSASPRTLDNRSAAVRISGWRIIGG